MFNDEPENSFKIKIEELDIEEDVIEYSPDPDEKDHSSSYKCKEEGESSYSSHRLNSLKVQITLKDKIHDENVRFQCEECPYYTNHRQWTLQRHMMRKHSPKEKYFYCGHCSYMTNLKHLLRWHIKTMHLKRLEIQYYYCGHCSYGGTIKSNLRKHLRRMHSIGGRIPRCEQCRFTTYKISKLKQHILEKHTPHEQKYFYCGHCDYKTKFKSDLRRHIKTKHLKDRERHQCPECWYSAVRKDLLKKHTLRQHTTEKQNELKHTPESEIQYFYCDHCYYKTKNKYYLRKHLRRVHTPEQQKKYFYCEHCSYKTNFKYNLHRHNETKHLKIGEPLVNA